MTTTQETTHSQDGERSRQAAAEALEELRLYDVARNHTVAKVSAVLSVSSELADTNDRILSATIELGRIANAVEAANDRGADFTGSELTVVRGEIARTDTKASILLAAVAIVAGPLVQQSSSLMRQSWPIEALGIVAAVVAGTATWLLLDVVLPRLHGVTNASFLHYARTTGGDDLREALGSGVERQRELVALSQIAERKFRLLGRAGFLLKTAGLLFAATAGLALTF
ncbi:Pycsar system effector family protein [Streptomyces sp. NPDC001584]|uniref:Pycsar system effector family protein n=1 Tax=Streptomyces sp. NPDC001584 TaxID=3154521 RepID=UPI0033345893